MGRVFEYAKEYAEENGIDIDTLDGRIAFDRHVAQLSKRMQKRPSKIRRARLEDFTKPKGNEPN